MYGNDEQHSGIGQESVETPQGVPEINVHLVNNPGCFILANYTPETN